MSRLAVPALAAFLVLQTGCAAVAKFESPSLSAVEAGSTTTTRSLGFLWGIIPPAPISLERCGAAGIKKMKVKQGLLDSFITYATMGIVVSYKVKVTCGAGTGAPQ